MVSIGEHSGKHFVVTNKKRRSIKIELPSNRSIRIGNLSEKKL